MVYIRCHIEWLRRALVGLGCRWQACLAWVSSFTATDRCVELMVGVLRYSGMTVVGAPADGEAATKNAIFVAMDFEMDRLAYDMLIVKNPDFKISETS